jgi:acid phosphatase type 7
VGVARLWIAASVAAVVLVGATVPSEGTERTPLQRERAAHPAAERSAAGITVAAAGDLCGGCRGTASRVAAVAPDFVVTIGDHAYSNGLLSEFRKKYGGGTVPETRWGRPTIKDITLPGYGNHDCMDYPRRTGAIKQGCDGAIAYFGPDSAHGTDIPGTAGSYFTVIGDWLLVHLNSAGDQGKGVATPAEVATQNAALQDVLAADTHTCEVVVWHHPRYSSGDNSPFPFVDPWFRSAARLGVDVVLSAHDHSYERFAPVDESGRAAADGTRQFVAGTGGANPHQFSRVDPNSQARVSSRGILTMQLRVSGYNWAFLNEAGTVRDSGSDTCHS